ncbi:sensor histidine kinase [Sphingomonas sp.]|jgi:two-component sensor histidine kinase|uniref:sensor histidine kinase n=1 Tax=Sphingomonas sp. TaxID=28214 RepID=UPI002EDA7025
MTRTEGLPFFDGIVGWSIDHPQSPIVRYAAATALIVAVAILRALFVTSILPWLLFIPAILIIGLTLAEAPAIYASVLSAVLAGVSLASPAEPLWLNGPQWTGSLLFLLVAFGVAFLAGELRAGLRRTRMVAAELAERAAFLSSVLASSTDCIKVLDLEGRLTFMSEGGMKVMEIADFEAVKGCPWPDFWRDVGNAEALEALAAARRGQPSHFVAKADTFRGTPRWWDVSVSPIPGPTGLPDRILSVSRDTTALMAAQEQQRLLNGELGHRLKNILTLVQSIASQTFRRADSLEDAGAAFSARLAALGKATDVLTATAWQSATLRDIARAGLTSIEGFTDRVTLDGPDIELGSQIALALTLALHELTTNAYKYGALSNDTGTVAVKWTCDPDHNEGNGRFTFLWQEAGGPPVSPPKRQGFGSRMIERSLQSYFRGETSLDYHPAGLVFRIDAPMPKADAMASA